MSVEISSHPSSTSAIAIIGIGCLFPDAANVDEYWRNIKEGRDAIGPLPLTHWQAKDYYHADPKKADHTYAQTGGFLKPYDFDPLKFGMTPSSLEATDTTQLLGMVCAHEALLDAGYGPDRSFDRDRVACIIGVTGTLELVIPLGARLGHPIWKQALAKAGIVEAKAQEILDDIAAAYVPWQEASFPGLLGNVVAGRIANRFDLGGTNSVVDAACASSLAAVHMAVMELQSGRADMVITGGMDTFNDIFMYMCFSKTPALSASGNARPFDADGDGTALGEGLGAVILKRLDDAVRDADRIYGVLRGIGSSSDGKGQAVYAPKAEGQMKALQRAYDMAGVSARSIELVEGHGTGTKVGDGVELEALTRVYRAADSSAQWCTLGSVKSQIGHTKAAAGAAGLIKAVMALHHKILPPTIKVQKPHPLLLTSPFFIHDKPRPWISASGEARRAAVSAFGFGGSNYHAVLEEYSRNKAGVDWDPDLQIFAFGAADLVELQAALANAASLLKSGLSLRLAARLVRKDFKTRAMLRLSFVARGMAAAEELLAQAKTWLLAGRTAPLPKGLYFGEGTRTGGLAFIFAGQGSQEPGMLRELACSFPEFIESLSLAERILKKHQPDGPRLNDLIYPPQAFDDAEKKQKVRALTDTRYAQLSLGALGAASLAMLARFGIEADAVAGHSYGEVLALHAAGVLSLSSMLELSYWRGHLMATHGQTDGAMLAVMSSAERIQEILKDHDINFEWANFNAPQQVVLGGSAANCQALAKILKKAGIGSRRLEVSTAFHTSYVQAAVAPFQAKLEDHSFAEAKIPVYANSTAAIYPLDPQAKRHNLSQQIGSSVRFSAMLDALAESSIRTVLEIGPQKKLTGLLRANLADRDILTLDAEPGSSLEGLAQLLAQLAALAHHLDLEVWDAGPLPRALDSKKSFTVSISGANYRNPTKEAVPAKARPVEAVAVPQLKSANQPLEQRLPNVPLSPLASDTLSPSTLNSIQPEDPMSSSTDWQRLEKIMHDMHDIQRKTADAHTLFLENQRQFQGLLQGLIHTQNPLGSSESASRQDFKSPINSPKTQPYKEPAPLPERKPKAADPIKPKLEPDSGRAPSPAYSAKNSLSKPEQSSEKSSAEFDVFEVLARCTGYPAELLKLEMQLEADLGIDSIKKVEIFSQLQSLHSSLEADSSRLGDVQTIADLVALLPKAVLREQPRIGAWAASPIALAAAVPAANHVSVLQIVAEKTGFPVTMLLAEMELEADLGIDSIKKVEIFSAVQEQLPEAAKLGPEALHSVRTLADLLHLAEADDSDFQLDTKALGQHSAVEEEKVWRVIADRTGYPREVLQESMSLEADLGIDSIKRVEIFSALSDELPSLQGAGQERIAELQTVGDLIDLARQAAVAVEKDVTDALLNPDQNSLDWDLSKKKSPAESKDKIEQLFEGTHGESIDQKNSSESRASELSHAMTGDVAEKAFQNFNARQQFEQDLSLQSLQLSQPELVPYISSGPVRQWRRDTQVWIADDGSSMARTLMLKLQERGLHVKLVSLAQVDRLQAPEQLHGLILLAPSKLEVQPIRWLSLAFRLLRKCGPALKAAAGESLFAVVSRYGGHFGVDGLQSIDQVYGSALAALVKTVAQEWDGVHARALDMAADFIDGNEAAQRCLETLLLAGPVEMGVTREQTFELQLKAFPWPQKGGGEPLAHFGELILVTGGARGVTAASLLPLVKQWKPKLVIWGRTALESFEHPSLAGLEDASSLQRALLSLYPDLSRPRDLAAAYQKLMQQREMRDHLAALKAAGAQVVYEVVDVSQDAELRHAFARLYEEHGVPQGILHGAGVIRDKFILDQKDEEFTEVLATKLRLLPHLEEAARRGTRWQILFSSSTARLGRKGQVAYGVANETLNKFAQLSNHLHPRCYVLAFNWGPWAGGMVNDGLKKIFAAEGVATISLDAGSALVYQSLAQPQLALHELMVLGREESLDDPMAKTQKESLICAFDINIKNTPILLDHVIKQRAVVPAALILEYLAAAAQSRFPELSIQEIKDFRVLKGIVLDADQSISVAINLVKEHQDTSSVELEIQMLGLVGGVPSLPHARAIVLFGPRLERSQSSRGSALPSQASLKAMNPYADYLFHGENLQMLLSIQSCQAEGLDARFLSKFGPQQWSTAASLGTQWMIQGEAVDAAFQAAIVWSRTQRDRPCLPAKIGRIECFAAIPQGELDLRLRIVRADQIQLIAEAEILDKSGQVLLRLEAIEAVMDPNLAAAFTLSQLPNHDQVLIDQASL